MSVAFARIYPFAVIRLDTFRALHERDHALAAYCSLCQRWAVLDLARLIAEGRGNYVFVGRKPRCRYCGNRGEWQLRPPTMKPGVGGRAYV
jgi:hypothetical protein